MSKPVGELTIEPEPSPIALPINYALFLRHELLRESQINPTQLMLGQVASLHVFKEDKSHSIKADIVSDVSERYRKLDQDARGDLVYKVKDAMARSALLIDESDTITHSQLFDDTSAIMNHQPLLFEPYGGAMLRGDWDRRSRLHFEATDVSSPAQRLILLGGLAAFINFMTKEKQKVR